MKNQDTFYITEDTTIQELKATPRFDKDYHETRSLTKKIEGTIECNFDYGNMKAASSQMFTTGHRIMAPKIKRGKGLLIR
jgi:hypothetical protein